MKNLTKKQRNQIYWNALCELSKWNRGMCFTLSDSIENLLNLGYVSINVIVSLPEFAMFGPDSSEKEGVIYWYSPHDSKYAHDNRFTVLSFCYEMTK